MTYTYRFGHNFTTTDEELTGYDDRVVVTPEQVTSIENGANIEIIEGTIELTTYDLIIQE